MAHPCSGRATAHHLAIDDRDAHAATREFVRACRAHNPRAHNNYVIGGVPHTRMPIRNGSRGSRTSSPSAFTNADPLMLGNTLPSRTLTAPSNTLPVMLSCLQI